MGLLFTVSNNIYIATRLERGLLQTSLSAIFCLGPSFFFFSSLFALYSSPSSQPPFLLGLLAILLSILLPILLPNLGSSSFQSSFPSSYLSTLPSSFQSYVLSTFPSFFQFSSPSSSSFSFTSSFPTSSLGSVPASIHGFVGEWVNRKFSWQHTTVSHNVIPCS